MGSALFMGMPVTSVIARSGLNVRLNAETRLPALVQAGFVFSSVVFMSETISMIPMPALSGMLITTGLGMLNPTEFKHCYAVQKSDALPFVTTIGGMLALGLAEGIGIGCLSALALNYGRFSSLTPTRLNVQQTPFPEEYQSIDQDQILPAQSLWRLNGPINFISMFEIDDMMRRIQENKENAETSSDPLVLDMQDVTAVEFTGVEELVNRLLEFSHQDGTQVQMLSKDGTYELSPLTETMGSVATASQAAPKDGLPEGFKPVPLWYDSPNWRPDK